MRCDLLFSFGRAMMPGILLVVCVTSTGCVIARDRGISSVNFPVAPAVEPPSGVSATATAIAYEAPASQGAASTSPWVALPSDDGCLLPPCRPHTGRPPNLSAPHEPSNGKGAARSADPNCYPPGDTNRAQGDNANCAECKSVEQSLTHQAEQIEVRLNARIEQLEEQLKESMAQTQELRTLLMKSSQETVRLQHEVMECKGTIAQMQADFKRQQLDDLKSLEGLSNSLRRVLTAEAEPDSSEATR